MMITNRSIETPSLVETALNEVVESAQECGVSKATLVELLRKRADELEAGEQSS